MEVSSEPRLAVKSVESVLFAERAQSVELTCVADEEFPQDMPLTYDWMLQPVSQRASRRVLGLVAVTVAALLIAISFCLVYSLPRSFPSVLALPSSSSH
jgi:hypothetical protein